MANDTATKKATSGSGNAGDGVSLETIENFLNQKDFELVLTYGFLPEPIRIPAKLILDADIIDVRQKFYAQPADKQAAGEHAYHVEFISSIVAGPIKGLPGFDALIPKDPTSDQIRQAVRSYFANDGAMSKKLAAEIVDRYVRTTTPLEFFR
jgi:hypothetical protein